MSEKILEIVSELSGNLIFFVVFGYVIYRAIKTSKKRQAAASKEQKPVVMKELQSPAPVGEARVASDGHVISAADDISCARFGHHHEQVKDPAFPEAQYIVHNEPPEGYINLNGKLLRRSEADDYMKKHG